MTGVAAVDDHADGRRSSGPERAVADLPARRADLVAQPVRLGEVLRRPGLRAPPRQLDELLRRSLVGVEQVVERQHLEHLAQLGVADGALAPVGLADPVEHPGQRLGGVEVVGERVEERVAERREVLGRLAAAAGGGRRRGCAATLAAAASRRSRVKAIGCR